MALIPLPMIGLHVNMIQFWSMRLEGISARGGEVSGHVSFILKKKKNLFLFLDAIVYGFDAWNVLGHFVTTRGIYNLVWACNL